MEIIADLHLHSRYSRAVSPKMTVPEIAKWAKKKGLGLVAAPDWTHPLWFRELRQNLVEVGEGIYQAKSVTSGPKFVLSTEIESNYSQGGKPHRIHNLILVSSLEIAEKINEKLRTAGVNLFSDGRPKTGLTSIELCRIVFSASPDCLVIPCHAWTPHYSLYGSRSGFDSLEECFGEYATKIYAIESGLSSDPAMNWRITELDSRTILSFSDAHSPSKMSREATVFNLPDSSKLSFSTIGEAIKNGFEAGRSPGVAFTIEFYPEEGKYHYTGHRNCGVKHAPEETEKLGEICPVCGRPLTVGVMHRVEELASRRKEEVKVEEITISEGVKGIRWGKRPPFINLVPLMEILAEVFGTGYSSQTVLNEYNFLTEKFGSEFNVLIHTPIKDIASAGGEKLAEAIKKVRERNIFVDPGFDGVFGKVNIWPAEEAVPQQKQMSLF